jgi:formylglycine-generating enzyme required for sulfatase activity
MATSASSQNSDTTKGTTKVGSYDPNPWGFYDMYGNVGEICGDGDPYDNGSAGYTSATTAFGNYTGDFVDPRSPIPDKHPSVSTAYVVRGGNFTFTSSADMTSVSRRKGYDTGFDKDWGFRVCLTAE